MKILFTCTTSEYPKYKEYYNKIRDFIVEEKHVLTRDWLKMYEKQLKNPKYYESKGEVQGTEEVYNSMMNAVFSADLVIVEDTVSGFSSSHIITLAIKRNIPTLVLWSKEKKKYFSKKFIHGIRSDYLQISEYDLDNYKAIIKAFINKYEESYRRHRFHLVIDDVENRYLDWAQYKYSKSKTRLIRNGIRKLMDNDQEYERYLGKR